MSSVAWRLSWVWCLCSETPDTCDTCDDTMCHMRPTYCHRPRWFATQRRSRSCLRTTTTLTTANGINSRGDIVGRYVGADRIGHSYLLSREERDDEEAEEIE